jgi:hypothetical protein
MATWVVAALTAASGLFTAVRIYETHPRPVIHLVRADPAVQKGAEDGGRLLPASC